MANEHVEYADEIGPRAAELYNGKTWGECTKDVKHIILSTIRGLHDKTPRQTALEQACGQAIDEWYAAKAAPTARPVAAVEAAPGTSEPEDEPTPKKKGGK